MKRSVLCNSSSCPKPSRKAASLYLVHSISRGFIFFLGLGVFLAFFHGGQIKAMPIKSGMIASFFSAPSLDISGGSESVVAQHNAFTDYYVGFGYAALLSDFDCRAVVGIGRKKSSFITLGAYQSWYGVSYSTLSTRSTSMGKLNGDIRYALPLNSRLDAELLIHALSFISENETSDLRLLSGAQISILWHFDAESFSSRMPKESLLNAQAIRRGGKPAHSSVKQKQEETSIPVASAVTTSSPLIVAPAPTLSKQAQVTFTPHTPAIEAAIPTVALVEIESPAPTQSLTPSVSISKIEAPEPLPIQEAPKSELDLLSDKIRALKIYNNAQWANLDAPISKQAFSKILVRLNKLEGSATATISDSNDLDIKILVSLGVLSLNAKRQIFPDKLITEEVAITALAKAMGLSPESEPGSHWSDAYVKALQKKGLKQKIEIRKNLTPRALMLWVSELY